ncbi:MAG: BtrH N-terminal domain-containing protein [Phototrophicaceae bacterium]
MPILDNYTAFDGYYFQSGSIRNALDYQGVKAPHTQQAFSEALLFGVSGGMNFGYFYFRYEGYDPQVNILTRNTFNLFEPILERLGIPYDVKQTTSSDKARQNLIDALDNGEAPIVEADMWGLSYNALNYDESMWAMMPLVVYGYDDDNAYIADRARVGLTVPRSQLDTARARIKKDKNRLIILGIPNEAKLASAVTLGIWDCIKLFTEKPPKGSANNFGFKAYQRWIKLLTKPTTKGSWAKTLPRGRDLFTGLTTAFHFSQQFGKDSSRTAERDMMADFLEEVALILNKPELAEIAPKFRLAGAAWQVLGDRLLPHDVPLLQQAKHLLIENHELFLKAGNQSTERRLAISKEENDLKQASEDFPLTDDAVSALQQGIADQVQVIHDLEFDAIMALQSVMS